MPNVVLLQVPIVPAPITVISDSFICLFSATRFPPLQGGENLMGLHYCRLPGHMSYSMRLKFFQTLGPSPASISLFPPRGLCTFASQYYSHFSSSLYNCHNGCPVTFGEIPLFNDTCPLESSNDTSPCWFWWMAALPSSGHPT